MTNKRLKAWNHLYRGFNFLDSYSKVRYKEKTMKKHLIIILKVIEQSKVLALHLREEHNKVSP